MKLEKTVLDATATLSKDLNITGLSEIELVKSISSPFEVFPNSIGSQVIIKCSNPAEYKIEIMATVLDLNEFYKKETIGEFLNTLRHEMAHVDDRNNIPFMYSVCDVCEDSLDFENVSWRFALKIWSEFKATYEASSILCLERINRTITHLNVACTKLLIQSQQRNVQLIADIMCCMAYLLGEITDKEYLAEKVDVKIDIGLYTPTLEHLSNELSSLLKSYPEWVEKDVLSKLRSIFVEFVNATY